MTYLKFCGLRRTEDIAIVNAIRPDYAGFILSPGFGRSIEPSFARLLKAMLDPGIKAVGVFVNADPMYIVDQVRAGIIDVIQLHGDEDVSYLSRLKSLLFDSDINPCIIKSFKVASKEDVKMAENFPSDYILLDSGTGTGVSFDWDLLEDIQRSYFLAGGLNPDNVSDAILRLHPYGVDVSSGIETAKVKDKSKAEAFARSVRDADGISSTAARSTDGISSSSVRGADGGTSSVAQDNEVSSIAQDNETRSAAQDNDAHSAAQDTDDEDVTKHILSLHDRHVNMAYVV